MRVLTLVKFNFKIKGFHQPISNTINYEWLFTPGERGVYFDI
jgi:hypothetical protein